jgi:hypothetical protein
MSMPVETPHFVAVPTGVDRRVPRCSKPSRDAGEPSTSPRLEDRGGRQRPGGGEFGDGVEDAADQQGEDEVAAAVAVRAEDSVMADLARRAEGD